MQKVVAHLRSGEVIKGTSLDVAPTRPICHVKPPDAPPVEISLEDLKALFFVRSFEGDPERDDESRPDPSDPRGRGSTVVRIRFGDGEEVVGLANGYPPKTRFFFIVPVDPDSNNIRILVNRDEIVSIEAELDQV